MHFPCLFANLSHLCTSILKETPRLKCFAQSPKKKGLRHYGLEFCLFCPVEALFTDARGLNVIAQKLIFLCICEILTNQNCEQESVNSAPSKEVGNPGQKFQSSPYCCSRDVTAQTGGSFKSRFSFSEKVLNK